MEPNRLMGELLRTARKLGLQVRIEPFETQPVHAGGLCWVRGRQIILVDENASLADQLAALAAALSELDLEAIYLAPEARQVVEAAREGGGGESGSGAAQGRGARSEKPGR